MARAELLLTGVFGGLGLAVIGVVVLRLVRLRPGRRETLEALVPWGLWASLVYLIWKMFIVYATEFVHFGQYAFIGFLVCLALDRGRYPMLAFLITTALGFVDELYQHYLLHMGDQTHWMDWSDPVLDALGAAGGILPFTTLARLRGETLPDTWPAMRRAVAVCALAFLPLLLLTPEQTGRWIGNYRRYPFWGEYENDKPTHWPDPREGVPLCIGSLLLVGLILEPRRRALSQQGLLLLSVLTGVAIVPHSRKQGQPVHEPVPRALAPRAATAPRIDGSLDDAVWAQAPRLGPFVRTQDGGAVTPLPGSSTPERPLQPTWARVAWDDACLYVAWEVTDPDPWARDVPRDTPTLPGDEVVELFLDDGGDEVTYAEVEVSPLGTLYDLFCLIPQAPVDYDPWAPFLPLARWDAQGVQVAVAPRGTVHVLQSAGEPRTTPLQPEGGYVVELAFPWENFRTATTPSSLTYFQLPPRPGDRWRFNLYRVERPRITPEELGDPDQLLDEDAARAFVGCDAKRFGEIRPGFPVQPDGRFRRGDLVPAWAGERAELQAWSPTWTGSFHRPPFFGVLELGP